MVMLETKEGIAPYLAQFERFEKELSDQSGWFSPIRNAAIAAFTDQGFPTTRHEEWRFTNVSPIVQTSFVPSDAVEASVTEKQLSPFLFGGTNNLLVFVNGRLDEKRSSLRSLEKGVIVTSLKEAFRLGLPTLQDHLGRHANYVERPFNALNTAFVEEGAFVHIPAGKVVADPIHILYVSTSADQPFVAYPRTLVVADANSQAKIVESYAGPGGDAYFTNAVTEVVAGDGAVLDTYKIVRESLAAYHVGCSALALGRSSNVSLQTVTLGGALVRNDVHAVLDGEGCECTLNGLYLIGGRQHVDNHLRVEHAQPHCTSWEYYKGVLNDAARGVFTGRIVVHKEAQKTDAKQTNMSLLLSEAAQVESKPQLEIFADDVKCTHGATIGQIDSDAMFYLRSRGLSESLARSILIHAFAHEIIEALRIEPLRAQLEELLLSQLPRGQALQEAV